jgi:hypothetical protein
MNTTEALAVVPPIRGQKELHFTVFTQRFDILFETLYSDPSPAVRRRNN